MLEIIKMFLFTFSTTDFQENNTWNEKKRKRIGRKTESSGMERGNRI